MCGNVRFRNTMKPHFCSASHASSATFDSYKQLVTAVPSGVSLTALVDSCGSGTIFNLPYTVGSKKGVIRDNASFKMETVSCNKIVDADICVP